MGEILRKHIHKLQACISNSVPEAHVLLDNNTVFTVPLPQFNLVMYENVITTNIATVSVVDA